MISIKKFEQYVYNESAETPETIVMRKLDQIEDKIRQLFNPSEPTEGEIKKFGQEESEDTSDEMFKDLHLVSCEKSQFAKTYKSLKIIYEDDEYRYDVVFSIDLKDAVPQPDQEFDPNSLQECDVNFKRYPLSFTSDDEQDLKRDITKENVKIDDINEDLFMELVLELDKQYPSSGSEEEFKIETE